MKFKEFVSMQKKYIVIGVIALILVVSGVSYAVFQQTSSNQNNQIIRSGDLAVEYIGDGSIPGNLEPVSIEDGLLQAGYDFTVKNIGSLKAEYIIKILNNPEGSNFIDHSNLYVSFDNGEPILLSEIEVEDVAADNKKYNVYIGSLEVEEIKEHNVKVWLKEDAPTSVIGKSVNLLVEVQIEVYRDQCDKSGNENLLQCQILAAYGGKEKIEAKASPSFNQISGDSDTGMYAMEDDYGTSYYFRGQKDVLNNNVIFAGFQWKIIRINGDGSIKLIYNGTCSNPASCAINSTGTSTQTGTTAFNSTNSLKKHVGYTYDTNTNSTIKALLETWYETNLLSFDNYISDTLFCTDRTERTDESIYYAGFDRLRPTGLNFANPKLTCSTKVDSYTKNDINKGNKMLSQKVGLITADEISVAGTVFDTANSTMYLNTGVNYWTMTPSTFSSSVNRAYNFVQATTGTMAAGSVSDAWGVRPVINLKGNISIESGNGGNRTNGNNPYVIKQ